MQRSMFVAILFVIACGSAAHAQWGTLKGMVVLDGEVAEPKLLVKGPVPKIPGAVDVPDESVVVDPKTKGIANVGVWLVKKPAQIHPDLVNPDSTTVTANMTAGRFAPHVCVVRIDQTFKFVNLDAAAYNAHSKPLKNVPFNIVVAGKGVHTTDFRVAERLPVLIVDDIHPWMSAYTIVVDHPYAAVTDKDGNFEIKNLPVGEHEFKVWHERPGYVVNDRNDPKKGLIVTINDGEIVDVTIDVPVKSFTEPRK